MFKHTVIIPLSRVGCEEFDIARSLDWGCPIPVAGPYDKVEIPPLLLFVDPAIIRALYQD